MNTTHQREVDHQAVVANRLAGDAMSTAPHGNKHAKSAREVDRVDNVGSPGAPDDERWAFVDGRIPNPSYPIVVGVMRPKQRAVQTLPQPIDVILSVARISVSFFCQSIHFFRSLSRLLSFEHDRNRRRLRATAIHAWLEERAKSNFSA